MSNQSKMTLEEKIVQTLKDETLFKLVGDEDAITQLVERAIKESLFKDHDVPNPAGYGSPTRVLSPVMSAAADVAKAAARSVADKLVAELAADQSFQDMVRKAMAEVFVVELQNSVREGFWKMGQAIQAGAFTEIRNHIMNGRSLAHEQMRPPGMGPL